MAESLLLPVVRAVAGKATDELVKGVTGMWGIDDDRDKLERQLLGVQCKLADAKVKSETNRAIKRWMKDLKDVAYEADDVLDDFEYEALRREDQISDSAARKVFSYFTPHSPLLFRLTMSRKLKNVLKKIDKLVEEMNKFDLVSNPVEAPQVPDWQTHSGLDEYSEIFGRDDDKAVVVELMLDQQNQRKVQVLPIIGMGGLGKTTLAKMVYNEGRVQNHFEMKMWHCVSENFEAVALVKSVIELATNKRCDLPDNIELLRVRLQEVIGRKRFLLVLDDVWNEDERKWEDELKPLLCFVSGLGSVILVTSQSHKVATIMGTLGPHELECFNEDDSWKLFSRKAFSKGVEEKKELVTIGRRIVEKCKGLPLALKMMGGLMSSKHQVQEWKTIAESNIGETNSEVTSILKLSYRHLSSEMKQCFAFCAIFHKDYEMDKDMLIQLWIANGFIQGKGIMDLVQKGEHIFNDFVWRSFLQDVKGNGTVYNSCNCKMHDLVHDLAKAVSDECATVEELIQQKASIKDVLHLWLSLSTDELKRNSGLLKGIASLRTLFCFNELELSMESLRVLRWCDSSIVKIQLINAKHLRYLDLSGLDIVTLPDSICVLYNLQTLRLNECSELKYLPDNLTRMKKLIHLYLIECYSLERMPLNMGLLKNLRTLSRFVVDSEAGRGIEGLKKLQHLSHMLDLYNLRKVKSEQDAKEASLHLKQNITELSLYWGPDDMTMTTTSNEERVLESLAPHGMLRILRVDGYGDAEAPQWMRDPHMFLRLRKLEIFDCSSCKELPIVWLSAALEYLRLCGLGSITTLSNTPHQIYPKLKYICLDRLPKLERWVEDSAGEVHGLQMFPVLESLEISECPELLVVPVLGNLINLKHLDLSSDKGECISLSLGCWRSLEHLRLTLSSPLVAPPPEEEDKLPSLQNLRRYHIVGWLKDELRCLVRLRTLEITGCNDLVEALSLLPRLESLTISSCDNLLEIPMLPTSLEDLGIFHCQSLVALPSNLGSLARLRNLTIHTCISLRKLPDGDGMGMDGLTSLEKLKLWNCPGIETFPEGLLQRLPALLYIHIGGCPELERRCIQGGEYLPLLSSIPHKFIWAAA